VPTSIDEDWIEGHYLNEKKTVKMKVTSKARKEIKDNIGKAIDVSMDEVLRMQYTGESRIKTTTAKIMSLDEYEEEEAKNAKGG
jgi:hypothetical protein